MKRGSGNPTLFPPRKPRQFRPHEAPQKFRPWLAALLALLVFTITLLLWQHRRDQALPSYQGRSVRVWFADYCRASVLGDQLSPERRELRRQDTLFAMLSMGTSAVPFLVEQAFRMEPVSTLHSNLFELLQAVPEAAGGGSLDSAGAETIRCRHAARTAP